MKKFILIFLQLSLCIPFGYSQISKDIEPKSLRLSLPSGIEAYTLPALNFKQIEKENEKRDAEGEMPEIGKLIPINLNLREHGTWTILPSGDRIWRVQIESKGALAISLYYNQFSLPENSTLHIYNSDQTETIGAFTSENNKDRGEFATGIVRGEKIILEYYEPLSVKNQGAISINYAGHAYRDVKPIQGPEKNFGDSDPCEVNVNCSEGNSWQDEKRGVARILLKIGNSNFWCSGSLVNNVNQDCTPYFLTAWHCGEGASTADFGQWIFYFNYEAAGCTNPGSQPAIQSMTGASLRSHSNDGGGSSGSDYLLVELSNSVPDTYNPYFNGWDANNTGSPSGVGIHHPAGDIKKISTYTSTLVTTTWGGTPNTHWRVNWVSTTNGHGVTEGGSSGSPIFNNSGLLVGTLTGGASYCTAPNDPDSYGKMSYHWDQNSNPFGGHLRAFLDPLNTGVLVLNGTNSPCGPNHCINGIQDGDETGVDCGGSCVACPTCIDGIQNGDETGIDCGGSCPNTCPLIYCQSAGQDVNYEYIDNVNFGSINLTSGANGGYFDFTFISTSVEQAGSYPISLTPNFAGQTYPEFWSVWIDFNQNAIFEEPSELVFQDNGSASVSGNIIIPQDAKPGATRMRVTMSYNAYATGPCATFQYGEVEDYTVIVTCNLNSSVSLINGVGCPGDSNGSAQADLTGGLAPFTYLWDNGETGPAAIQLNAGAHSLTVTDANNCESTATIQMPEPPPLNLSGIPTDESFTGAADGAIDATVSGGTPNYIFSWSTGSGSEDITGLTAGDYSLTVTDANGCTISDSWTVNTSGPAPLVFCPTVYLKGCFNPASMLPENRMRSDLKNDDIIPLVQPYEASPWNYSGIESFGNPEEMPFDMVDWVLVVVRDGGNPGVVLGQFAGVLHTNGSITGTDGSPVSLAVYSPFGYYLEIFHRGHLPIVSAMPVQPDAGNNVCYDFTGNMSSAYRDLALNDDPLTEMLSAGGTFYGMVTGNVQSEDCQVDVNDINALFSRYNTNFYYGNEDVNMDGQVDANDINSLFGGYNYNCHRPY